MFYFGQLVTDHVDSVLSRVLSLYTCSVLFEFRPLESRQLTFPTPVLCFITCLRKWLRCRLDAWSLKNMQLIGKMNGVSSYKWICFYLSLTVPQLCLHLDLSDLQSHSSVFHSARKTSRRSEATSLSTTIYIYVPHLLLFISYFAFGTSPLEP